MIPGPDEYLSFLMAAPDISDDELQDLSVRIVERFGSEIRGLVVPGHRLPAYKSTHPTATEARVLERDRRSRGDAFRIQTIGRNAQGASILRGNAPRDRKALRRAEQATPIEKTSDMPLYIATNPFYRDTAVQFYGVPKT